MPYLAVEKPPGGAPEAMKWSCSPSARTVTRNGSLRLLGKRRLIHDHHVVEEDEAVVWHAEAEGEGWAEKEEDARLVGAGTLRMTRRASRPSQTPRTAAPNNTVLLAFHTQFSIIQARAQPTLHV